MNISPDDNFVTIFGEVSYKGKILYNNLTLGETIWLSGNSNDNPKNLAFPLVGAYVNANAFPPDDGRPGFPYSASEIIAMYQGLAGNDEALKQAAETLKTTLDLANNLYDATTDWP